MADLPAIELSYSTKGEDEFEVRESKLGDGYTAGVAVGINNIRQMWTLNWKGISTEDKDVLVVFFRNTQGVTFFTWTPPGEASPLKWKVKKVSKTPIGFDAWNVSCDAKQTFNV